MTLEALFLVILTACLLPWMAWISTVLIKIEIRLAKGDASQVLKMNSGATAPEWAADATGSSGIAEA